MTQQSTGVGRRTVPPLPPARNRVRAAVRAEDPLTRAGIAHHVGRRPDIELLPEERAAEAAVWVVATQTINGALLHDLRALAGPAGPRFVLILDRPGDADLLAAIEIGVAAVLWRPEASAERLVHTLLAAGRGGGRLPADLQGRLAEELGRLQREVLAPRGLTAAGLDVREVEVLRYIAAGLDTTEIARRMLYSERTVKGILYGLMSRLELRNRSHAVAYAMRAGVL